MIKDLKDLQKLLNLCRKQGVTDITLGDTNIKFGELSGKPGQLEDTPDDVPHDALTDEQLMFFSAGGNQQ